MVISPLQRKMLRDLRRMGPQAITIALVIASAVAGFIACLSAVDALERSRERFYREARFGDVFVSLVRAPRSLLPRILELDGIAQAEAGIERVVRIDLSGRVDPLSGRLIGLSPAARAGQSLNQVLLRQGHWPASQTAVADQLEALVSEGFAQAHGLRPGDRVQALIQGRRRHLLIT
ncbi:MAG: ABC transporter permease, partial [Burkholderiales bacterium]